ncbi:SDR family NAD(P)-dependent oxidoreductase [Halieaceae bacterium IMCC14734]|uniref:SDR family NAD(P)-dependent oxidoreductase n=1 Tax=Candidatus Litorirhabdus singularis TaxID=2518993 RepID=A0ABT3TIV2_9GAMM|nr:SDR family NAD(P)-dependent oxidoreductase [Candidatus Litorirhabdus singularis]MCX2982237.1 SDR family NAD(P)-dependent oxidoreductase [Candidatus Litorirhabdus singularis]
MTATADLPAGFADKYGPWALVAGGSEGVGESFARMLAAAGLNLLLVARREQPMQQLADSLQREHDIEVRYLSADLTQPDVLQRIQAFSAELEVGLFIYNVGSAVKYARYTEWSVDDLDFMINLNCRTPALLCNHFAKAMVERGRGGLMLLSSMAAMAGSAWLSIYPASKAFDQMLAEGLWHDLKPSGVDAMCLVLGATNTPSHAHVDFEAFMPGGAMSCDQAAQEGLMHLGEGPLWVAGEDNRARLPADYLASRPAAIDMMSWGTAVINGLPHEPATEFTEPT